MTSRNRSSWTLGFCLCATALLSAAGHADDMVEFLNGSKVRGTMGEIRKADRQFDFEVKIGNRTFPRTYAFGKVHAVTMKGKRYVLTKKSASSGTADTSSGRQRQRSRREIERIIKEQGGTPPDWLASTPLAYPKTLDLSWPLKPPEKGWNNRRNVGQYLWDVIYPNTNRWRSGVKLVHHCTTLHKDNSKLLTRDMKTLGGIYFRLFQDYPRAAFWLKRGRVTKGDGNSVMLAECYWRMGSRQMAMEVLNSRKLPVQAIKLFGDMGQTRQVMKWLDVYLKAGRPHEALLLAGDALRQAGQYDQAIRTYERVFSAKNARNKQYNQRYRARAQESIEAIKLFDNADVSKVSDGTYTATSTGYNGALEVELRVASGRIESIKVTKHREKQFYSAIADTTSQISRKQSVRGIDGTSRATITSQAIVNAAAKALASGSK